MGTAWEVKRLWKEEEDGRGRDSMEIFRDFPTCLSDNGRLLGMSSFADSLHLSIAWYMSPRCQQRRT